MRLIGSLALAASLAIASGAEAQTTFPTPAGSSANGAVAMCPSAASAALKVPCDTTNPLAVNIASGGGGAATIADGADVTQGTTTDAACSTDNGTCTEIALLKRANQRLTTLIAGLSQTGITPVVCGSASSSCVLKAAAGNLYSVYAECSAACWLQVFNATAAPSNGATTAGIASGNMVECIPIIAGGAGGISSNGMPPSVYTVGITATISSTTCATLTLATTGFVKGLVQ